jgi:hypothetical protein
VQLGVVRGIGVPRDGFEKSVKMFVVTHVVEQTALNDSFLDLLAGDVGLGLPAAVDPVPLDDVCEEQHGGELQLWFCCCGVEMQQGERKGRLVLALIDECVGLVDLVGLTSGRVDDGESLRDVRHVDVSLHSKLISLRSTYNLLSDYAKKSQHRHHRQASYRYQCDAIDRQQDHVQSAAGGQGRVD